MPVFKDPQSKIIVFSCTNAVTGGVLTISRKVIKTFLDSHWSKSYSVIFLFCHSKNLFKEIDDGRITFIEKKYPKKNPFLRMFSEYIGFWFWCLNKNIDVWFSLHDFTPRVIAKKRIVYFNQSLPFYEEEHHSFFHNPRLFLIKKFYNYFYAANILRNDYVITQQDWIRKKVVQKFKVPFERVVVARPLDLPDEKKESSRTLNSRINNFTFIYPALPYRYKNFDVIQKAIPLLEQKTKIDFRVILTITGTENHYSKEIFSSSNSRKIIFTGFLTPEELLQMYETSDFLVYPSKIESWGLPLSEYRQYKKPILAADLPYSRETLAGYEKAAFFDPDSPDQLAELMKNVMEGNIIYHQNSNCAVPMPFASNWKELIDLVIGNKN